MRMIMLNLYVAATWLLPDRKLIWWALRAWVIASVGISAAATLPLLLGL